MTQLALAVDADDEMWTLDDLPTPEAPYVEVEDELIEVRSRFPSSYYTLTGETLPPRIRVRRGIAGTTKASHIQGSTLTPNYGLGSGGGGGAIAVTGTVSGSVAAATALELAGTVTDEGGGVAAYVPSAGEQTIRLIEKHIAFDDPGLTIEGTDPDLGTFPGVLWATLAAETLILGVFARAITDSGDSHSWINEGFGDVSLFVGGSTDPILSQNLAGVQLAVVGTGENPAYYAMYRVWPADDTIPYAQWKAGDVNVAVVYVDGPLSSGTLDIYLLIAEPTV